jgi:hypothetical protein
MLSLFTQIINLVVNPHARFHAPALPAVPESGHAIPAMAHGNGHGPW